MNRTTTRRHMQVSLTALVGLTIAACGSSSRQVDTAALATGQQTYGETTSEQAVRTFFDAAAADDYPRMWSVFGTRDGPAVERFGIQEIEPRMIVLAGLLRNRGYQMRVANLASYGPERVRYMVQLRDTRNGTVNLPVLTVPDRKGLWFVEQLDMDRMTPGSFP